MQYFLDLLLMIARDYFLQAIGWGLITCVETFLKFVDWFLTQMATYTGMSWPGLTRIENYGIVQAAYVLLGLFNRWLPVREAIIMQFVLFLFSCVSWAIRLVLTIYSALPTIFGFGPGKA